MISTGIDKAETLKSPIDAGVNPNPVLISIDEKGKRDTFPIILVTFKLSLPSLAVIEEKYISVPILASIPAKLNEIGVSIRMPILDPVEKPAIVTGIVAPIIVDNPNPNAPLLGRKVAVGGELLLDLPGLRALFFEGLELKQSFIPKIVKSIEKQPF